jgi:glycosyltransferase involved in cell wall biosynthesis
MSQNQKTILHVIDTTGPGGAETVFINLADKLRAKGFRSIALIRGKGWVYEELLRREIKTVILPCKGSFNFTFLRQLIALIRKEKVDIIQSHLLGSNIYCAMAGILTRRPVFATFHGAVDVAKQERFLKLKCLILNFGITKFIAVSKTLKEEIKASGLLKNRKTTVIYNGIDTQLYFRRNNTKLINHLSLNNDAILVGSLGNIRPAKAYDILIKTAAIAVQNNNNLHFIIAGHQKEPLMSELKKLMSQLNINENVHFIGFQSDSAEFLGQLDLFLLSSSSEGFSISTIEAMATNIPVIATRCGGPEEIITNNIDGYLVEVNSPEEINKTLCEHLSNKEAAKVIAAAGTLKVKQKFSEQTMLKEYTKIYTTVPRITQPKKSYK